MTRNEPNSLKTLDMMPEVQITSLSLSHFASLTLIFMKNCHATLLVLMHNTIFTNHVEVSDRGIGLVVLILIFKSIILVVVIFLVSYCPSLLSHATSECALVYI